MKYMEKDKTKQKGNALLPKHQQQQLYADTDTNRGNSAIGQMRKDELAK